MIDLWGLSVGDVTDDVVDKHAASLSRAELPEWNRDSRAYVRDAEIKPPWGTLDVMESCASRAQRPLRDIAVYAGVRLVGSQRSGFGGSPARKSGVSSQYDTREGVFERT
jgi:hypothetical protein